MPRKVAVVAHTHWDREWHRSLPALRVRLVEILDDVLPVLEADPGFPRFLFDGQMAMIDDYLEARPAAAAGLRRLAVGGRVSLGPWYVLMDEFCVSGETIVRNLQLGMERAAGFGRAMAVGYLPDMFGHIAQMPQILQAAGIDHAVVWRGVPASLDRTAFWWRAPDGSTVRAEYLPVGYANGAATPPDATDLLRRLRAHEAELAPFLPGADDPILWMSGSDHQAPTPWLAAVVDEANDRQDDYELVVSSLPEHLVSAPTDGLPSWTGELRSGARANLLMGVLSNRVDIKSAAARAERALERRAEPLCALWMDPQRWPSELLAGAWLQVIRNSAHDSICACSADDVGLAVLHRFADARAVADALAGSALRAAGAAMADPGPVVVNPSSRTRSGIIEMVVVGETVPDGTQLVERVGGGTVERSGLGADLGRLLGELAGAGWLPPGIPPAGVSVEATDDGVELSLTVDRGAVPGPSPAARSAIAEAWAQAGASRDGPLTVRVSRPASVRVLARAADVPGFGWAAWAPGPLGADPVRAGSGPGGEDVFADNGLSLENGLVHVAVDPADGTFALDGLAGLDRLVDGGDEGDTYNYSPPALDTIVDRPDAVTVEAIECGPVRGRLRVVRRFRWPSHLADGRRVGAQLVEVRTTLEVRAGEATVRVTTAFDNSCRDRRLRAVFPLPSRADGSVAECAFGTVARGLDAEGGPHERALPTFPSRRFVSAGGLTVTHEGLLEYEVVDDGRALALTLLRATGFLSRPDPAYRPNAAGPEVALEGPQMIGPVTVRYAVATGVGDVYALADDTWLPLETVVAPGGGSRGPRGSELTVTGAEVSALRRQAGALEVRVFNPSEADTVVDLDGRSGWLTDLRGGPVEAFTGAFALRGRAIATARLDV